MTINKNIEGSYFKKIESRVSTGENGKSQNRNPDLNSRFHANGGKQYDSSPSSSPQVNVSLPSHEAALISVPPVSEVKAHFQYNYFVQDEGSNESVSVPTFAVKKNPTTFDAVTLDLFNTKIPRYIIVKFKPIHLVDPANNSQIEERNYSKKNGSKKISQTAIIAQNLDKIMSEESFANFAFTGLELQDDKIDDKLFNYLSGSIVRFTNGLQTEKDLLSADATFDASKITFQDGVDILNDKTPPSVSNKFMDLGALALEKNSAIKHYTDQGDQIINDEFEDIKKLKIQMQINNKFISSTIAGVIADPINLFGDELQGIYSKSKGIQKQAIAAFSPSSIFSTEFDTNVEHTKLEKIDTSHVRSSTRVAGYIIDKYEQTPIGLDARPPIILEGIDNTTFYDLNVKFGTAYVYSVRTIVEIKIPVFVEETGKLNLATFLVSARRSHSTKIECTDDFKTPAPQNLKFLWDHEEDGLRLVWDLPVGKQRDIKYFQVFRRSSIRESFQLVKMFDFNDSSVIFKNNEIVDKDVIELTKRPGSPITTWIDRDFEKSKSKFIYAVVAIDAHGQSSGYSAQYEVSFDIYKNVVINKLLSHSGAPKPYPNLHLDQNIFPDTMNDTGHTRLKVIFDPECLQTIRNSNDIPKDVITTDRNGYYLIQLVNTDVQKLVTLRVNLKDLRPHGSRQQHYHGNTLKVFPF